LCDTEFKSFVQRNSIDARDGKVDINLTGRYDSLQKFLSNLSSRFLFLEPRAISFGLQDPTPEIPSPHLILSYSAEIEKPDDGVEETQEGGSL